MIDNSFKDEVFMVEGRLFDCMHETEGRTDCTKHGIEAGRTV